MLKHNKSSRLEELKGRVNRCCCKYCGGELEIRRIIFSNFEDARVEIFCKNCDRIEYGVEPEIYHSAKYFVKQFHFNWYTYLDDNAQTEQMTIAKICEIMSWHDKQLGILGPNGFLVPVEMNQNITGASIVYSNEELSELEQDKNSEIG